MNRRVVVTGAGPVSCVGVGRTEFTAALREGRSGQGPITSFDPTGFAHWNACEITDFDPRRWLTVGEPGQVGRATAFAVAAARLALDDARIDVDALARRPVLVAVGTCDGEAAELDSLAATSLRSGLDALSPGDSVRAAPAQLSIRVAIELGLSIVEPVTIGTACAAGNYAIGYAFDAIRSGDVDIALCGGAEALSRKLFAGFYRVGTIASDACRPFDADRQGILTGEGAGILVLEDRSAAIARGAPILAEIIGFGLGCDAVHPVAPDTASVAETIRTAHRDAGIAPGDVDLISAHGTGTRLNDTTEVAAIREVFGPAPPPTISIKSMIGHAMGAASAIAAIASITAITAGFLPPTINHRTTDPLCPIDCVPNDARPATVRVVQNNGLAFGGNNAVILLRAHSTPDNSGDNMTPRNPHPFDAPPRPVHPSSPS
ncbi:beta-ketoacyl-[acyl-carrier-protein] synthase family protein [Stackebrandtia soli]|uniref:beta-ketoacyl-[acyl-carrier-protein] synthase family protein n=1 Tax=Stackebrandtia soli TaxID=1892856 RepID=UPI0039E8670B